MSICREWSLVKRSSEARWVKPLKCRSWSCDFCRPTRKAQLIALAVSGDPNRFLTLTINPRVKENAAERLALLAHSWRVIVKRLRRSHPGEAIEYLAIVEETKAGEPHLHILLRSPYLAQSMLSEAMDELAESPIVDIRKVRSVHGVVSYVAKYIAKAPAQFGRSKRYWSSRNYELGKPAAVDLEALKLTMWEVIQRPMFDILTDWSREGYALRQDRGDTIVGFYFGLDRLFEDAPPMPELQKTSQLSLSP